MSDRGAPAGDHAPDHEHDDRADNRTDEAGALSGLVPAEGLPQIGGDERADHAENGGQDEAGRLIVARHQELGDDAGEEADDDGPDNAHENTFSINGGPPLSRPDVSASQRFPMNEVP